MSQILIQAFYLKGAFTTSISKKETGRDQSPNRISKEDYIDGHHHSYSPLRRMINSSSQPPNIDGRNSMGDYGEEAIYHYASGAATFQLRSGSPPTPAPPTPPSPPGHNHNDAKCLQQKGFAALVYQPPSLHDVDDPNIVSIYIKSYIVHVLTSGNWRGKKRNGSLDGDWLKKIKSEPL